MAYEDVEDRLDHIEDAIDWALRLVEGATLDRYRRDRPMRDAVERNLERLSEASRYIPERLKSQFPQTPWIDIANLGNRLRHGYEAIDDGIVWNIVEHDLPALRHVVERIRERLAEGG